MFRVMVKVPVSSHDVCHAKFVRNDDNKCPALSENSVRFPRQVQRRVDVLKNVRAKDTAETLLSEWKWDIEVAIYDLQSFGHAFIQIGVRCIDANRVFREELKILTRAAAEVQHPHPVKV
jgi:hypothetical protein